MANIANGFVSNIDQYVILRFIAGIGLAGELGAGITLVAEILPKHLRGYGTSLVASIGLLGAVLAYVVADLFDWRIAYIIGGGLACFYCYCGSMYLNRACFSKPKKTKCPAGVFYRFLARSAE